MKIYFDGRGFLWRIMYVFAYTRCHVRTRASEAETPENLTCQHNRRHIGRLLTCLTTSVRRPIATGLNVLQQPRAAMAGSGSRSARQCFVSNPFVHGRTVISFRRKSTTSSQSQRAGRMIDATFKGYARATTAPSHRRKMAAAGVGAHARVSGLKIVSRTTETIAWGRGVKISTTPSPRPLPQMIFLRGQNWGGFFPLTFLADEIVSATVA